jgi:hypothetical protein
VGDKAEWVEYSELRLMGSVRAATFVPKVDTASNMSNFLSKRKSEIFHISRDQI